MTLDVDTVASQIGVHESCTSPLIGIAGKLARLGEVIQKAAQGLLQGNGDAGAAYGDGVAAIT